MKNFAQNYLKAFANILFLRLNCESIRKFNIVNRISLYVFAAVLFYIPIIYFIIKKCVDNTDLIIYFVIMVVIHILSKFMLCNSKKIHHRFSVIKKGKHFFIRTLLILEYVAFMWIVYMFYPLSCILIPFSLLAMSVESILGYTAIFNLFLQHSEQFILFGGIISYILFIIADGYKKLKSGFLPDYLGLYAVLTVISASIKNATQKFLDYITVDVSDIADIMSRIFALSNDSMSIVASVMTLFFAVYSLYTAYEEDITEPEKSSDDEDDQ